MPSLRRRLRVDDHAAMAGDVVGDLLDQLHADVAAPRVLHAARGEQPERIVRRPRRRPARARPPTARRNPSTPAAPGTRRAACPTSACRARAGGGRARRPRACSRSWYGSSKRRPCSTSVGYRYQSVRGKRLGREAVLLPPVEAVHFARRRSAPRSPRGRRRPRSPRACGALGIEREIAVRALERHAAGALVDRRVVLREQPGALRELGRDVGEVARLAARSRPPAGAARSPRRSQNCSTYFEPPMRISCRLSRSVASGSSTSAK